MIAEWFDLDGQKVLNGDFCLITKSKYRAAIDASEITGGHVSLMSNHFIVINVDDKRLIVSKR